MSKYVDKLLVVNSLRAEVKKIFSGWWIRATMCWLDKKLFFGFMI